MTHSQYAPDGWAEWHQIIDDGHSPDSTQFRLLSFWMADGVSRMLDLPVYQAYLTVRMAMTFLLLCLFHLFLLFWFRQPVAMLGTIILAAIQPLTFLPFLQESDMVLFPIFLFGVWAIRDHKYWCLLAALFIGCFAKESIAFLIPLYVIYRWPSPGSRLWRVDWRAVGKLLLRTAALIVVWFAAFYLTRNAFYEGVNSWLWQLPKNLTRWEAGLHFNPLISVYLFFIPFLGMMWILPFMRLKQKPLFLRRVAPYTVVFFVLTALMGWPHETRLLVPLALVVIPASIAALFPGEIKKEAVSVNTTPG